MARKHMKNNKATEPDSILAEALKTDIDTSVELLYSLFTEILEKQEVPSGCTEGYFIKLHKKGDLSNCSNYRGITLLSVHGKVFNRIILERIKGEIDPWLRDQQAFDSINRDTL